MSLDQGQADFVRNWRAVPEFMREALPAEMRGRLDGHAALLERVDAATAWAPFAARMTSLAPLSGPGTTDLTFTERP